MNIPIALQLYAVRDACAANYAEPTVRWPGWPAERGLRVCSAHTALEMLLGEGDVPWSAVLSACREGGGAEWFIIEQERYPYPQLECARRCLAGLRRLLD